MGDGKGLQRHDVCWDSGGLSDYRLKMMEAGGDGIIKLIDKTPCQANRRGASSRNLPEVRGDFRDLEVGTMLSFVYFKTRVVEPPQYHVI